MKIKIKLDKNGKIKKVRKMSFHRVKETLNIPGSYKLLMRGD